MSLQISDAHATLRSLISLSGVQDANVLVCDFLSIVDYHRCVYSVSAHSSVMLTSLSCTVTMSIFWFSSRASLLTITQYASCQG